MYSGRALDGSQGSRGRRISSMGQYHLASGVSERNSISCKQGGIDAGAKRKTSREEIKKREGDKLREEEGGCE